MFERMSEDFAGDLLRLVEDGATILRVEVVLEMPDGATRLMIAEDRPIIERRAMLAAVPATGGVQ